MNEKKERKSFLLLLHPLSLCPHPYDVAPVSLISEIVAPVGSLMMQKRPTFGMSVGGTQILPPSSATCFALASTSSTETYGVQCEGVLPNSAPIWYMPPISRPLTTISL